MKFNGGLEKTLQILDNFQHVLTANADSFSSDGKAVVLDTIQSTWVTTQFGGVVAESARSQALFHGAAALAERTCVELIKIGSMMFYVCSNVFGGFFSTNCCTCFSGSAVEASAQRRRRNPRRFARASLAQAREGHSA